MGDCVLRHCPSPITAIVYTKYFAKTMAVIGEGQCRNTQSPITDPPEPTLPLTLPGQTSRICTVLLKTVWVCNKIMHLMAIGLQTDYIDFRKS